MPNSSGTNEPIGTESHRVDSVAYRLDTHLTTNPTNATPPITTMNDQQTAVRIDSREQRRQTAERRRLRAFNAPEAWGGAGLSAAETNRLIKILETQHTA
jgi:hypothetical protein